MISSEDGFHFDNQKDKEVIIPPITIPEIGDRTHTRDPKIWRRPGTPGIWCWEAPRKNASGKSFFTAAGTCTPGLT